MRIKITCPVREKGLMAGLVYDVPDAEAKILLEQYMAIRVESESELVEVTTPFDKRSVFVEVPKKARRKEVDNGNG